MRIIIITCLLFVYGSSWAQEELLNQCFVFVLDTEMKTDLREATFDLPFAAMRRSKENEKKIVPHYAFDIQTADAEESTTGDGLSILSMRSYEYGEILADNEIAFFVMEWPESHRPKGMGPMLASFPSINGLPITTNHLVFNKSFELSDLMVSQLGLTSTTISPGKYRIEQMDIEY